MKKLLTLCCIAASLLVVGCNRTADKGGADGSELYGYVNIRLPHIEGMHDSLGQITFDNYFMIYGDYNRENYDATPADLPLMQEQLERSLVGTNWQEQGRRTEDAYNTLMVGQPAILQKYSPQEGVLTMIILMKYRQENGAESTVVSAANCLLIKKRLLSMAYYMAYQNASTIDALKQRNDAAVKAVMAAN